MLTPFTGSDFGDGSLFFKHQRKEDDFKIHPEWVEKAVEISNMQAN
jgi:hypothetical protein